MKLFKSYIKKYSDRKLLVDEFGNEKKYGDIIFFDKLFPSISRGLVLCLIQNDIGGIGGYLSFLSSGAICMLMDSNASNSKINSILEKYSPQWVWLPSSRRKDFDHFGDVYFLDGYYLLKIHSNPIESNNSLVLLLQTSGSTGSPKFVRLSEDNILSNAKSIAKYLDLNSKELPITTLPPTYSYGLSVIHSHFIVGATIAVTNKTLFDRAFWDFLRNIKVTSISGVPYHYEMLKKMRFTSMNLPNIKTLTQAGGHLSEDLSKEFAFHCVKNGMRFYTMYGQTEATARMSYLPHERSVSKAGSIGIPIPGGSFSLESDCGEIIDTPGISGQLIYKGPNVSMGYADGVRDLTRSDLWQGILRTGDVAKVDSEGYYFIVGRLNRFIKIFGRRVNLSDVENFIHGIGYNVACSGRDDALEIYMVTSNKSDPLTLKKKVADYLQINYLGVVVYGISSLPINESGKIQYSNLKPILGDLLA